MRACFKVFGNHSSSGDSLKYLFKIICVQFENVWQSGLVKSHLG